MGRPHFGKNGLGGKNRSRSASQPRIKNQVYEHLDEHVTIGARTLGPNN